MKDILGYMFTFLGGGGVTLIVLLLNRRWSKQDKKEEQEDRVKRVEQAVKEQGDKLDALVDTVNTIVRADKVILAHEINCIARSCIYAKKITLNTKKTFVEMHEAYEALPTKNGLVMDTIMKEVDKLEVIPGAFATEDV